MPRGNTEKAVLAMESSGKEPRFCELNPGRPAPACRAVVKIELGTDISIEIRNADRAMLESYVLEVLTKSC